LVAAVVVAFAVLVIGALTKLAGLARR